jgi:hypothetical protein
MNKGGFLAASLAIATLALIAVGTIWPIPSALAYAGRQSLVASSSTPEAAIENLGNELRAQAWQKAYDSLANKAQFTEPQFVRDVTGYYPCLRTYATLDSFEVLPIHGSDNEADVRLRLHWSTVVGTAIDARDIHVVRNGDRWQPEWPASNEPVVPPQVIPVNYLRWDVINRGPGDDWAVQDVDAPHVSIVDMHPVQRAEGVVIMGELLNEDVVPAYVSAKATLLRKDQSPIATEDSFDNISHLLLPKQVTPFLIVFPDASLSDVGSVRMSPFSALVSASADPVIAIDNERLNPAPGATLTGQLINQSGQIVNVAHVLGTLYDKSGHVVWVVDQYVDSALLPQTPVPFEIHIPQDLAKDVSSQRTVVASYSFGGHR